MQIAESFVAWALGTTIFGTGTKVPPEVASAWVEIREAEASGDGGLAGLEEHIGEISVRVRGVHETVQRLGSQVGEIHEAFEDDMVRRAVLKAEPLSKKLLKRVLEMGTKGLLRPEDLHE